MDLAYLPCDFPGRFIGTSTAGVFGTHGDDHTQLRRHDVQPFTSVLANLVHLSAATEAFETVEFDHLFNPGQVFGQVPYISLDISLGFFPGLLLLFVRRLGRIACGFGFADRNLKILGSRITLILGQFPGLLTINDALSFRDQLLLAFSQFLQIG